MANIWTGEFWKATSERAVRTAAQAGILVLIGDGVESAQVNALVIDWAQLGGYAAGGAILAVLFSLVGNGISKTGPSFTDAEIVQPAVKLPNPDDGV